MTEGKKGKGSRRGRHEWRSLLAKFDGSGLGVAAFCRREAISAASLYRWRNLLGVAGDGGNGSDGMVRNTAPAFVDLGTLSSATPPRARLDLRLELGDGLTLHLVRH